MVSWCYLVDPNPPPTVHAPPLVYSSWLVVVVVVVVGGGEFLRYWVFVGRGRGGREDGLTPVPPPPGWASGVPAVGRWTSSLCPHSIWGRRTGSGRPSGRGVGGWPGGPVSGSRNPGAEPPESEAGPAKDKEHQRGSRATRGLCSCWPPERKVSNWETWRVSRGQMHKWHLQKLNCN